jgi:hypothetical protein
LKRGIGAKAANESLLISGEDNQGDLMKSGNLSLWETPSTACLIKVIEPADFLFLSNDSLTEQQLSKSSLGGQSFLVSGQAPTELNQIYFSQYVAIQK